MEVMNFNSLAEIQHSKFQIGGVLVSTGIFEAEIAIRSANCVIKANLKTNDNNDLAFAA